MGYPSAAREQARRSPPRRCDSAPRFASGRPKPGFAADREQPGRGRPIARRGRRPAPPRDRLRRAHRPVEHPRLPGALPDLPRPRGHGSRPAGRRADHTRSAGNSTSTPRPRPLPPSRRRADSRAADRRACAISPAWWDQFRDRHRDRPAARHRRRAGRRRRARRRRADRVVEARHRAPTTSASGGSTARASPAPAAFAQVIEPLIARQEYRAAMALLMTWLSEGETGPARRPVRLVRSAQRAVGARRRRGRGRPGPGARRRSSAGSSNCWKRTPTRRWLAAGDWLARADVERRGRTIATGPEFESAYEGMTYQATRPTTARRVRSPVARRPTTIRRRFPLEAEAGCARRAAAVPARDRQAVAARGTARALAARRRTGHDAVAGWLATARRTRDRRSSASSTASRRSRFPTRSAGTRG